MTLASHHPHAVALRGLVCQSGVGGVAPGVKVRDWNESRVGVAPWWVATIYDHVEGFGRRLISLCVWYDDNDSLRYALAIPHQARDDVHPGSRYAVATVGKPLRDAAHLREILATCRQRAVKGVGEEKRRAKISGLSARSIEARVDALAIQHGWTFVTRKRKAATTVTVRLDSRYGVEIDVPHEVNASDAVLAALPGLVAAVRDVYSHGRARVVVQQRTAWHAERGGTWRGAPIAK